MRYKIEKFILACLLLLAPLRLFGGNVTIITHGFNNVGTMTNGWLWNLAKQIGTYEKRKSEYGGNDLKTFYQVQIVNDQFKSKLMDFGTSFKNNPSGDIIIVLDWNPYSSSPLSPTVASTSEIAPFIARFLLRDGAFEGINGPLTQFPIHLIGHSRGGSLVCEIGRALAEYGVYTHQITTLDPHPLNNDGFGNLLELVFAGSVVDGSAKLGISKSVVFADNYYQEFNVIYPNGTLVDGAANRNLSPDLTFPLRNGDDKHGQVHMWYYATTYEEFPSISNGKFNLYSDERIQWFRQSENLGRTAGYIYSYRAGQRIDEFSIKGYGKEFLDNVDFGLGNSGNQKRSAPSARIYGNKSKNILALFAQNSEKQKYKTYEFGETIDYTQTTRIGNSNLKYKIVYQADYPNSQPYEKIPLYIFVDKFENIHFGNNRREDTNSIVGEFVTLPSTGEWNINNAMIDYSSLVSRLKPGFYRVGAVIGDGLDSRIFYANERIFVEPDAKIDIKYVAEQNLFGFTLFGTVGRQFVFERSFDLINWERVYSGTFLEYEAGNYSGKNFTTGTGIGPMTYWRLRYN
jgi:hypothetical protein